MNRKKWLIVSLVGISLISALIETLYYLRGGPPTSVAADLATTVFPFLVVLWIDADRRNHPQVSRCFDYGFLVFLFLVPYLPYYLCRTRGATGLLMCAGFVGLFLMGFLVRLLIYSFYYA